MNKRTKTVLSLSAALPAMALAAFLLIQPQTLSAANDPNYCIYGDISFSVGMVITAACPDGKSQTCQFGGIWSLCGDPGVVINNN